MGSNNDVLGFMKNKKHNKRVRHSKSTVTSTTRSSSNPCTAGGAKLTWHKHNWIIRAHSTASKVKTFM